MVRFLAWYINNKKVCNKGSYLVNIENEINKYKTKNPDRTPTVIFDFVSAITILIKDENEILSAGRQVLCTYKAEQICEKFKSLGVDLVFFIDGPLKHFKFPIWLKRVNDKYEKQTKIFDSIRNGEEIDLKYTGQMLSSYFNNFLRIARKYGKIHVSLHNECDIDLAAFATNVHATAVFALDTDFLIMPGDWAIWSPMRFNFDRFSTVAWNKKSLRISLDLRQTQMPIFSLLSGNDWVPYEKVQHIHQMFTGGLQQERLAEFIRRNFPRGINLSKIEFDKLVGLIYNAGNNGYSYNEAAELVNTSLDFYNYSNHKIPEVKPDWLKEHIEMTGSSFLYTFLNDYPLVVHQTFIDLSKTDVQPYAELALPIVRRQMGVVFYDKRIENIKKTICLKPSHEELYQNQQFTPIFPETPIPSLRDLIQSKNDEIITLQRKYEIFCWIISPRKGKLKVDDVMKLNDSLYLVPALVLYYLVKEYQITLEEADVVLLCIHEAINSSLEKLESIKPPEIFRERPFWISFVFVALSRLFTDSMLICGLFEHIQRECFDGFIFHKMYKVFLSMEREQKQELMEPIREYRLYAK